MLTSKGRVVAAVLACLVIPPAVAPAAGARAAKVSASYAKSAQLDATLRVTVKVRVRANAVALQARSGKRWTILVKKRVANRRGTRSVTLNWRVKGAPGARSTRVVALRGKRTVAKSAAKRLTVRAKVAAPQPSTPALPSGPQPAGTVLTRFTGPGATYVVSGPAGFTIITNYNPLRSADRSTWQSYDVAGNPVASVPEGTLTGACGAADLVVPGHGRVILSQLWSDRPAAGVTPSSYSMSLQAHSATTGALLWSSVLVPWTNGSSAGICSPYDGGTLETFAATRDGAWGLWGTTVINLTTGALRSAPAATGVLGNWIGEVPDAADPFSDDPVSISDPATGAILGSIPRAKNAPGRIEFDLKQKDLAWWGVFDDNGSGRHPVGTSHDGQRLIAVPDTTSEPQLTALALPAASVLWQSPPVWGRTLVGDGANVAIARGRDCAPGGDDCLLGLDDTTGAQLWQLPSGMVCGLTNSQMLLAVNGQLATIDLRSGAQVSYTTGRAECPSVSRSGISVRSAGSNTIEVVQTIAP